jgi:predicted enzyme related to lactoylglutathione lyase
VPLRSRGGVWFALAGGGELHIGVEEPFVPAQKAHSAFRLPAEELEDLAKRLGAAGERVEWDESLPGVRRFYTSDPWGNRLELIARAR